jgi:hypothetical protein
VPPIPDKIVGLKSIWVLLSKNEKMTSFDNRSIDLLLHSKKQKNEPSTTGKNLLSTDNEPSI